MRARMRDVDRKLVELFGDALPDDVLLQDLGCQAMSTLRSL